MAHQQCPRGRPMQFVASLQAHPMPHKVPCQQHVANATQHNYAFVRSFRPFAAHVDARYMFKPRLSYRGLQTAALNVLTEGVSIAKPSFMSEMLPPPPPITKSNEAFEADGVQFVWGTQGIDLDELNDLFQRVGFPRRDSGRLAVALANTHSTVWVRAARKSRLAKEGQLLGFARATSDGALSATIWDVAVTPSWQRNGLGRAMVERLTAALVDGGISTVTLYAEPGVVGLYEKLGFVRDPQGVKGLAFQSKSAPGRALVGR